METGYQRGKIQEESLHYEHQKHDGSYPIVGVNTFRNPAVDKAGDPMLQKLELIRSTEEEKQSQVARVREFQNEHAAEAGPALARLKQAATRNENLFAVLRRNVRIPEVFTGDLMAQVAAGRLGGIRLGELFGRYGTDVVLGYIDELLERVGLPDAGDHLVETYSKGMKQRLGIADALVKDPEVLILDEPTVGLDLPTRQRFLRTLQGLARHGKTIILVTHRIEEIFPEINRVILLQHGRVLRDGPKGEVLTSRNLSAMFEAPVGVRQLTGYYTATSDG